MTGPLALARLGRLASASEIRFTGVFQHSTGTEYSWPYESYACNNNKTFVMRKERKRKEAKHAGRGHHAQAHCQGHAVPLPEFRWGNECPPPATTKTHRTNHIREKGFVAVPSADTASRTHLQHGVGQRQVPVHNGVCSHLQRFPHDTAVCGDSRVPKLLPFAF